MPYSNAVGVAIVSLENYLDEEIGIESEKGGKETEIEGLLEDVRASVEHLEFTEGLLVAGYHLGDFSRLRSALVGLAGNERIFEYFAGLHALDTLYRVERSKERILEVISLLPATQAPARSRRYLKRVVDCFLAGFDEETIVMARAVVEVLAEERWEDREHKNLGEMIKTLEREGVITKPQADDMWEINRQAREVIHDEPGRRRLDALDCVRRVSRLLEELHPATR